MHFGGMPSGGMVTGRSVFVPGGNRFVGAPLAGRRVFVNRSNNFNNFNRFNNVHRFNRFNNFAFRHHHRFRNFAFVGAPFFDDYAAYGNYDYAAHGNECWRQEWTGYGWQWVNVCYGYGY
jgi:hypothetical protein